MNYYLALKILAIRAVMKPDEDAEYRSICRWYSKTFHTPLHQVEELPEEDVLIAHYESQYEEMDDQARENALAELLETPEQKKAKLLRKDIEDAEAFEFGRQVLAEEAKKKLVDIKTEQKTSILPAAPAKDMTLIPKATASFEKIEPDVSIKFISDEEFESLIDGPSIVQPDKQSS